MFVRIQLGYAGAGNPSGAAPVTSLMNSNLPKLSGFDTSGIIFGTTSVSKSRSSRTSPTLPHALFQPNATW